MEWTIKINDKYFKEFVYKNTKIEGRHSGHTYLGSVLNNDDIEGLILVDNANDAARATVELPSKISIISNLMRWDNIRPSTILIEPIINNGG